MIAPYSLYLMISNQFIFYFLKILQKMTGSRYYHRYHGGGLSLQQIVDMLTRNMMPPTLFNGIYTFAGSQMSFRTHVNTVPVETPPDIHLDAYGGMMQPGMMMQAGMMQPGMGMMDPSMMQMNIMQQQTNQSLMYGIPMQANIGQVGGYNRGGAFIQQANITIAGPKTKPANTCCMVSTLVCGTCCIFPLCFMCCAWWKKIVYARYELSVQTYHDIGRFICNNPTLKNLTLTVIDNSFNAEKANILCQILKLSHLTGFTFVNKASQINHLQNEVDNFTCNMAPIKSLGIGTSLTWGDMIA